MRENSMNMNKITALTIATLMLAGTAAANHHGEGKGKKGAKFAKIDTNSDGFITKSEMMTAHEKRVEKHFAKLDADGDGKISKEEMRKGKKAMRKKMKDRMEKADK